MNIYLRDVEERDKDLLFEWANDESVRKNSFSTHEISYEEHCRWFENMMRNENCKQWILCVDDKDVAQIRLNIKGGNAEIGYSVEAKRRGEGLGKLILQLTAKRVREEFPYIKKLIAKVKVDNIASLKAFEDNGYSVVFEQLELNLADGM